MDARHHGRVGAEAGLRAGDAHVGRIDPLQHSEGGAEHRAIGLLADDTGHGDGGGVEPSQHGRLAEDVVGLEDAALALEPEEDGGEGRVRQAGAEDDVGGAALDGVEGEHVRRAEAFQAAQPVFEGGGRGRFHRGGGYRESGRAPREAGGLPILTAWHAHGSLLPPLSPRGGDPVPAMRAADLHRVHGLGGGGVPVPGVRAGGGAADETVLDSGAATPGSDYRPDRGQRARLVRGGRGDGDVSLWGGSVTSVHQDYALFGRFVDQGEYWRLGTSAFLHYGLLHLGMNMLVLWWLGRMLEPGIGGARLLLLYGVAMLGGSLGALLLDPNAFTAGASGRCSGWAGRWWWRNGRLGSTGRTRACSGSCSSTSSSR